MTVKPLDISAIFMSCVFLVGISLAADGAPDWQNVDQLCGQVQSVKDTKRVIRQKDGRVETHLYETPIRNAKISLYRAVAAEGKCCDDKQLKAETVSGRWGSFVFRNVDKGKYWLVVGKENRRYEMPIFLTADYNEHCCDDPNSGLVRTFWMDAIPRPKIEIHVR